MKLISRKNISLYIFIYCLLTAQYCGAATVKGTMLLENGDSMENGTVAFFDAEIGPAPDIENYFRMPEFVDSIDDQSAFRAKVPAGRYYIGARKDMSNFEATMAPMNGDIMLFVKDDKGAPKVFTVKESSTLNIGEIRQGYVYLNSDPVYISSTDKTAQNVTAIDGAIFANIASHLQGITVVAEKVSNTGKSSPIFFSRPSSQDGKFFLPLPEGGTYLLSLYGGTKFIGRFDTSPDAKGQKVKGNRVVVKIANREIKEQILYTAGPK